MTWHVQQSKADHVFPSPATDCVAPLEQCSHDLLKFELWQSLVSVCFAICQQATTVFPFTG